MLPNRPFPSSRSRRAVFLGGLGAVLCVASACSSISLSSSNASSGFAGGGSSGSNLSGGDGGSAAFVPSGDAAPGAAPTVLENPLCHLRVGSDDAGEADRVCDPDDVEDGGVLQCGLPDAGVDLDAAFVGQHPSADGGAIEDGGSSSDAGGNAAPIDANPPSALACRITTSLQACSTAGAGTDGAECRASADCANGYECVGSPGQCRHYCCAGNAVCDVTYAPSFCNPEPVVSGAFLVPVCIPVSGCTLFGKCESGETCAVVKEDGTTSCVPIGPRGVGQSCDEADCAAGLTCIGSVGSRTCYQLCHVAWTSECPAGTQCTGSAQLFQDPQFGICR